MATLREALSSEEHNRSPQASSQTQAQTSPQASSASASSTSIEAPSIAGAEIPEPTQWMTHDFDKWIRESSREEIVQWYVREEEKQMEKEEAFKRRKL